MITAAPASAADAKCEPEKLATKYPGLAGKTVKIAQDGESPPFSFRDPKDFNNVTGLDAELARAVFACAGVPVEIITGAWSGLLPAVIAGQADVMWDILYYTPERAQKVDFVSYMTAATGALVAKGNPKKVHTLEDVCGLKATAGLATVDETKFREQSDKCVAAGKSAVEVITTPDIPSGTRLMLNDRADVLMSGLTMVNQLVADNASSLEFAYMIVTDFKIAAAVTKGNKDLAQAIYDGMNVAMADGTYDAILTKYGIDLSLRRTPEILTK
jgi:polar amino acid transport system substrate-binding protein